MQKYFYLLIILCLLISCNTNDAIQLKIISNNNQKDSLIISDLITNKAITKLPVDSPESDYNIKLEYPTIGIARNLNGKSEYLISLIPNKKIEVTIQPDNRVLSNNLCDSLLNDLNKINNEFLAANGKFIFSTSNTDSLVRLCEKQRINNVTKISQFSNRLSNKELKFLEFQASARTYSFLFWFGRNYKKIDRKDSFFQFANHIDYKDKWIRTLSDNALYKCEIDYFQNNDSISSIASFLSFIDFKIKNKNFAEFLKAHYLTKLIEHPSYWNLHKNRLNSKVLKRIVINERSNSYFPMIKKATDSYIKSQKGEPAFNFVAEDTDGRKFKLSDFKNKVVFVETWATWCGGCLRNRPQIIKLSEKYKDNPNVKILLVSVDANKSKWINYLDREKNGKQILDLIVENGMNTEFGFNYNIKSIPKFILIDKNGLIYKSDNFESSILLEQMIDSLSMQ